MHRLTTAARTLPGWRSPSRSLRWLAPFAVLLLAAPFALSAPALGQGPAQGEPPGEPQGEAHGPVQTTVEVAECVPRNDNGLMRATVQNPPGGSETRLYFRWEDHGDFYYVIMDVLPDGTWWATPPKPKDKNKKIEYYVAVVDPTGLVVGRSDTVETDVTRDCSLELDDLQRGYAENLVIGETTEDQMDDEVLGFLCDGIVSRIGYNGILREDDRCRKCIVAWWRKPKVIIPAAVLLGGGITVSQNEASPSRP